MGFNFFLFFRFIKSIWKKKEIDDPKELESQILGLRPGGKKEKMKIMRAKPIISLSSSCSLERERWQEKKWSIMFRSIFFFLYSQVLWTVPKVRSYRYGLMDEAVFIINCFLMFSWKRTAIDWQLLSHDRNGFKTNRQTVHPLPCG